ncbi:unnamed protein product [Cyprideis torosa]|uniref:Uncharacterized protein n=1 Tax=Cyprideis torosa TaxID=163714 RepID=A0A7R8W7X2_9CRUS|nr:unnamed protein product [Cyprideis torosa]CAG0885632.1 unnamed protein product [Cyprideis torosa]
MNSVRLRFSSKLLLLIRLSLTPHFFLLTAADQYLEPAGCYLENTSTPDLNASVHINSAMTVKACVSRCKEMYYKVAGLQNGNFCSCGSSFGSFGPGECLIPCLGDNNEICGGSNANSIYFTGFNRPGPPGSLKSRDSSTAYLSVEWTSPPIPNGKIDKYKVNTSFVRSMALSPQLEPVETRLQRTPPSRDARDTRDHRLQMESITSFLSSCPRGSSLGVHIIPVFSYSGSLSKQEHEVTYQSSTTKADMLDSKPGTKYNVSVFAINEKGEAGVPISQLLWSRVGNPPEPEVPRILARSARTLTVALSPVEPTNGPLSAYHVVVIDESSPVVFQKEQLTDYAAAQEKGIPFWIAAEIQPGDLPPKFVVGNGQWYGRFFNAPLSRGRDYHVVLGTVSTLNGETRSTYPEATHEQHHHLGPLPAQGRDEGGELVNQESAVELRRRLREQERRRMETEQDVFLYGNEPSEFSSLTVVLLVAVVITGALLLFALAAFVVIRRYFGKRANLTRAALAAARRRRERGMASSSAENGFRRGSDDQELTVTHNSINDIDSVEHSYVSEAYLEEEDEFVTSSLVDQLRGIRKKVWNVPRHQLAIDQEKRGIQVPAAIHTIALKELNMAPGNGRHKLIRDLDTNIKAGSHLNIVQLFGITEEPKGDRKSFFWWLRQPIASYLPGFPPDILRVSVEYFPLVLKRFLLDCRAKDTHPVYAQKHQTVSSVPGSQLLGIAAGISRGMSHLVKLRILHRNLCAKSISLVDGSIPKIGGFAFTCIQPNGELPLDPTRWRAHEGLKYGRFNHASDVWAFGVLLWEIATLGATPYASVRSEEVSSRVERGLRLHQTRTIEDDLYQCLLSCWQVDSEERPTFESLTATLQNLAQDEYVNQLNFRLDPVFHYEPHIAELEVIQASAPESIEKMVGKPDPTSAEVEQRQEEINQEIDRVQKSIEETRQFLDMVEKLRALRAENVLLSQQVALKVKEARANFSVTFPRLDPVIPPPAETQSTRNSEKPEDISAVAPEPPSSVVNENAGKAAKKGKKGKGDGVGDVRVSGAKKGGGGSSAQSEPDIEVGRFDLRVGKIVQARRHPDADGLYVEEIDFGEDQLRTVVSGLVKFCSLEDLQNRMVIGLCNLKPSKMRGIQSAAMVMCASAHEEGKVEVLAPPPSAVPGDTVSVDGYTRKPDGTLKSKVLEAVMPHLSTNGERIACYKGVPWRVDGREGPILAETLGNTMIK